MCEYEPGFVAVASARGQVSILPTSSHSSATASSPPAPTIASPTLAHHLFRTRSPHVLSVDYLPVAGALFTREALSSAAIEPPQSTFTSTPACDAVLRVYLVSKDASQQPNAPRAASTDPAATGHEQIATNSQRDTSASPQPVACYSSLPQLQVESTPQRRRSATTGPRRTVLDLDSTTGPQPDAQQRAHTDTQRDAHTQQSSRMRKLAAVELPIDDVVDDTHARTRVRCVTVPTTGSVCCVAVCRESARVAVATHEGTVVVYAFVSSPVASAEAAADPRKRTTSSQASGDDVTGARRRRRARRQRSDAWNRGVALGAGDSLQPLFRLHAAGGARARISRVQLCEGYLTWQEQQPNGAVCVRAVYVSVARCGEHAQQEPRRGTGSEEEMPRSVGVLHSCAFLTVSLVSFEFFFFFFAEESLAEKSCVEESWMCLCVAVWFRTSFPSSLSYDMFALFLCSHPHLHPHTLLLHSVGRSLSPVSC
jgi:hypothetical protein